MCPPLPTSFHRVSAVFIFRWYSHKRMGLEGRGQQPEASDWTWWDYYCHFNNIHIGFSSSFPSHFPLPSWTKLIKPSPSNHTIPLFRHQDFVNNCEKLSVWQSFETHTIDMYSHLCWCRGLSCTLLYVCMVPPLALCTYNHCQMTIARYSVHMLQGVEMWQCTQCVSCNDGDGHTGQTRSHHYTFGLHKVLNWYSFGKLCKTVVTQRRLKASN